MNKQRGFTLVEAAIVMVVVGLLIGGVFMGRTVMHNARVSGTITQVTSYQIALDTFRSTYDELPGDMPDAVGRLRGCTAATACANGNGNGMVGVLVPGASAAGAPYEDIDATIGSENTQFWKHLAAAELIKGVNPGATTVNWGATHPAGKFRGGFFAREAEAVAIVDGLILVMRGNIQGLWNAGSPTKSIPPRYISQIDRKMDDSLARSGKVQAVSGGYDSGCGLPNNGINGPTGYNETLTAEVCDAFFLMK